MILYLASSRGAPRWDWTDGEADPTDDDKKNACDERKAKSRTLARTDNCGANNATTQPNNLSGAHFAR
jgi:hypothetical protein